jgi:hypothetical protein
MAQMPTPAEIASALNSHDHLQKSTDLPLLYAKDIKDITLARRLIKRIKRVSDISNWDKKQRGQEFAGVL